ncbi:MAG: hypothetical protein WBP03_05525 [Candidatus Saccharimonadales bacterium]
MKYILRFCTIAAAIVLAWPFSSVMAANKPLTASQVTPLGIDISHPQCKKQVPTTQAFGVVGVNGGTAASVNSCLAKQLTWASRSVGSSSQDALQLYVNTASPGAYINQISTWPKTSVDEDGIDTSTSSISPYETCDGTDSVGCAWQYGWNRARAAVNEYFAPAAQQAGLDTSPAAYTWWLDVETMNTWRSGIELDGFAKNVAALEGMTSYYDHVGAKNVGLYSTNLQWDTIVGDAVDADSPLMHRDTWYALGTTTKTKAVAACTSPRYRPLTGTGQIALTQFISGNLDYDVSCG